jgi:hypothetical protein
MKGIWRKWNKILIAWGKRGGRSKKGSVAAMFLFSMIALVKPLNHDSSL